MTSGFNAISSAAYFRALSDLPPDQRISIRTLRPSTQPNCCNPCSNAAKRAFPSGSLAATLMSTPIRQTFSLCCAREVSGQAAAPLRRLMNSRRLNVAPEAQNRASYPLKLAHRKGSAGDAADVRFGSKADSCIATKCVTIRKLSSPKVSKPIRGSPNFL